MEKKENQRSKSQGKRPSTASINNNSNMGQGSNHQQPRQHSPSRARLLLQVQNPSSTVPRAVYQTYGGVGGGSNVTGSQSSKERDSRPSSASGQGSRGSSSTRALIATLKAASMSQSPSTYPNIDPRTFPRPMSHFVGSSRSSTSKSLVSIDRSRNMRAYVEKAIAEKKVFTCVGVYPAIKNALKKRGWVEKQGPLNVVRSANNAMFRDMDRNYEDESDAAWVARNLRDYPPDFIWVIRRDNIDWKNLHKDQVINRFPKAWFTTKVGLTACLQQMHWFSEAGLSDTFFPRCYRLCLEDERQAFQEDFRLTACMSYLRHFIETFENKGAPALVDSNSKVTPLSIDFACRQLGNYIRMRRHEDIDWLLPPNFMSQHWDAFVSQYYQVVHGKKKIRFENTETIKLKYEMAKKTLHRIGQYWPQAHLDGVYNMWICKPGARSRGKGIVIMNTLDKIMELLNHNNYRESNWVVQKYMERPLLVYKTKFDIRQWFIITDWSPLTVWFYKESYIRFCTKPYILEDFHESIHLCNNAIQCRYQNSELRDSALPDENMWDCYTFQAYLKTIGKMDEWPKIYAGMKQAIVGVLLASQENVESKKGCFELYGADFMLSEDFNPWLIEINSCPCMAASTSVTARMCAQCLEDTIKVVIDRKANKNADVGMFEMIYRQNPGSMAVQQFSGHDLIIHGKKLTRDIDWPSVMTSKNSNHRRTPYAQQTIPRQQNMFPPTAENLTFMDLLTKLRMKNTNIFSGFVSSTQAQTLAAISNSDGNDKSLTGTLLNKMRSLGKSQQDDSIIPGMKRVYPSSKPGTSSSSTRKQTALKQDQSKRPSTSAATATSDNNNTTSLAYLTKYSPNNTNTFAELVRIGEHMAFETNEFEQLRSRPATSSSKKPSAKNPYLPSPQTAKTMEEVRAAISAASEKYGKISTNYNFRTDSQKENDNNADIQLDENILLDKSGTQEDAGNIIANSKFNFNNLDTDQYDIDKHKDEITNNNNALTTNNTSPEAETETAHNTGNERDEKEPGSDQSSVLCSEISTPLSSPSTLSSTPADSPPSKFKRSQKVKNIKSKGHLQTEVNEFKLKSAYSSVYMVYPLKPDHGHENHDPFDKTDENQNSTTIPQLHPEIPHLQFNLSPNKTLQDERLRADDSDQSVQLIDFHTPPHAQLSRSQSLEVASTEDDKSKGSNNIGEDTQNIDEGDKTTEVVDDFLNNKNNNVLPFSTDFGKNCTDSSESDSEGPFSFDFLDPTSHTDFDFIPSSRTSHGPVTLSFRKPRSTSISTSAVNNGNSSGNPSLSLAHRHSIPNRFSKRVPCHRVTLQPTHPLKLSGRRSGATFPLKKINLKLS